MAFTSIKRPIKHQQISVRDRRDASTHIEIAASVNSVDRNAILVDEEEARIAAKSDSFSTLSMNEYFSKWYGAGSDLQRDELENQMLGRTVIWNGYIDSIERGRENSIRVIVRSEFHGTAFLDFEEKYKADLLQKNEGDSIRFTGVIRSIIVSVFLEDCHLLNSKQ